MSNRSPVKSQYSAFLYRSLSSYLRGIFGISIRKIPVDPGFGCPNRDGTLGTRGCSFCYLDSFVPLHARSGKNPADQITDALSERTAGPFIVYLQAGTGTYASPEALKEVVESVLAIPDAIGLFIGTRPDCVSGPVLDVLNPYRGRKLLWLELGLQSSSDATLDRIGRGHDVNSFVRARSLAMERGIPVCAHIILGLPGEEKEEMMSTARFLAEHEVEGVKIHHLQVIKGTVLDEEYNQGRINPLDHRAYPALVSDFLEHLPPATIIHRLLSDAPDDLLIAPQWPDRNRVIQSIRDHMTSTGSFQGKGWGG